MLCMGPKSVTKSSAAARAISRWLIVSKAWSELGLQGQVIKPSAAEHRGLAVGLGVAVYLEHVELGPVADLDDGETRALVVGELRAVAQDLRLEHLLVETLEALGVVGDHGDMVQAFEQHAVSLRVVSRRSRWSAGRV